MPQKLFIWLYRVLVAACGIYFLDQRSSPGPLHWEHGVLAAGPPGKSGLHARGEGERVLALESREGNRAQLDEGPETP